MWKVGYMIWCRDKGFSFDLSTVPEGAEIISATLRIYQSHFSGDPYNKLGKPLVEHVSYDTFVHEANGEAQYTMAPLDNTIPATPSLSTNAELGYKTLDVTLAVRADLAAARSRAQFRLRFEKEASDEYQSNMTFWTSGESDTNQPELVIAYK